MDEVGWVLRQIMLDLWLAFAPVHVLGRILAVSDRDRREIVLFHKNVLIYDHIVTIFEAKRLGIKSLFLVGHK